jgi:pyruvate-formate lyase
VVRVAGYSAIFVNLSEEVQDQVIQRTVHAGF